MIYLEFVGAFAAGVLSSAAYGFWMVRHQLRKMMRPQGFPLSRP